MRRCSSNRRTRPRRRDIERKKRRAAEEALGQAVFDSADKAGPSYRRTMEWLPTA